VIPLASSQVRLSSIPLGTLNHLSFPLLNTQDFSQTIAKLTVTATLRALPPINAAPDSLPAQRQQLPVPMRYPPAPQTQGQVRPQRPVYPAPQIGPSAGRGPTNSSADATLNAWRR
jgi:hypothetical protein